MIIKIIKNQSGETRNILNCEVENGSQYEVSSNLWLKLYEDEFIKSEIQSGNYIVNNGTVDLSSDLALDHINMFQPFGQSGWEKKSISWQVHKTKSGNNAMSNASWFDAYPAQYASGSYSGYGSNTQPIVIPFNCRIVSALITFRRARFDWRSSVGSIFLEFGFYTLVYNGSTDYCRLGVELSGSFSGNDTGTDSFMWDINNFSERVGSNSFIRNNILGVQFRKDISREGQIYSMYDPIVLFEFKEF